MKLIENRDAQFILLGGFIVAIGLVITTVMLNNIIFQGNMAGEAGADPVKYDMVNLMQITEDEMKSAYWNATELGGNAQSNFNSTTKNFSANLSMIYAFHGEGVNVSYDISNWNNNNPAYFTNNGTAGGTADWTVIENVSNSIITMNITVTSGTFQILLKNASPSYINLNTGQHLGLIFTNATVTDPYSISFINGANAYGNYSITGSASGKHFIRARDYILYATVKLSASRMRANITIPVSVPW